MKVPEQCFLASGGTVADALAIIEGSDAKICLVVDDQRRLLGTVTDGDVRRGILRGVATTAPAATIMNSHPIVGREGEGAAVLQARMAEAQIRQLPMVNDANRVIGLLAADAVAMVSRKDNWVVLMAGGLGSRLRPLTEQMPKPLLPVGGKPVLETIIDNFRKHGFHRFYVSINYKAEMVKAHFGDGSRLGCEIRYLEEDQRLGTAGALGLLPEPPTDPVIVMNGDVLTTVDFTALLGFHQQNGARATMGVREYDLQVPYGVVEVAGHRITGLAEKPVHTFFVNAGIYVLAPETVALVPGGRYFDMTELFAGLIEKGEPTIAFPIREYWIDIGRMEDFKRADVDFEKFFE